MIKKITIILLCVLLLAGVAVLLINRGVIPGNGNVSAPGNTANSAGVQYDKWVYEVSEGNVILTAYTGRDVIPEIPTEINGMPVTALGDTLFLDNSRIREITIPDTIASIGTGIFENCSELTVVRLPSGLQRIPNRAFNGCKKLQSIQLPSGLKNIGASAFAGCVALTYVSIPDSVTSIGGDAFLNCTGITDFAISKNLTNLGSHAFKGTPWLATQSDIFVTVGNKILVKYNGIDEYIQVPLGVTQITDAFEDNIFPLEIELPSSLTSIGPHAFSGCRSLETVNIPETVRSIGESAFRGCSHLGPVTLPARLTSIGASAFQSCSALDRIVIPEGVKTLPKLSFANCENLRVLQIPESVSSIASDVIVYSGISELRVIKGSAGENFAIENNIPYVYEQRANDDFIYQQLEDGIQIIMYTGNVYDVVIPEELSGEKVVQLSDILFQHNDLVRSVSLPETITRISDYSFANMSQLRSVVFPETLSEIGSAAFMNDPLLSNLEIPESVINIADDAFSGCTSLVIYAPKDSYAFDWATRAGIRVRDNSQTNTSVFSFVNPAGKVLVGDYSGFEQNPELPMFNDYNEPVSGIADEAFKGKDIVSLVIPDGYESIGENSFSDISSLEITIPRSVTSIGEHCFEGSTVTIYGYNGSYAEEYARNHKIKFLVIFEWEL